MKTAFGAILRTARGEFDKRRDIADPDIGRLARGACDGVGRAFRRLDGHVEAELAEIAALQRVVESGRAAIRRKIEHHADLRGALCRSGNRRDMEQQQQRKRGLCGRFHALP